MFDAFNIKIAKEKGYYAYPPVGLQCISKALSGRGLEIDILDLNYELLKRVINDSSFNYLNWLNMLDEYIKENNPSVIGATCLSIYTDVFRDAHPLTALLRYLRRKDGSIVIAGGPIATNEYENYLKKDLSHFIIEGEGENRIRFLFDHLYDNKPLHKPISGIYFKLDGKVEETEGGMDTVDLKGNLIETYKNIPIEDYNNVGSLNPFSRMAGQDKRFTGIQLNRGCRANCKFCGVIDFMGKGLRQYPVEDLINEIHYLVKERGLRHFEILDDDFLGFEGARGSVETLLEEMAKLKREYSISWAAGNGFIAASLTTGLLELMRDSGCVGFRIGIESGNEDMLKRMRKPANPVLLKKTAGILQGFPGLFVAANYIIGLFGEETFGEMLDTFRFANDLDLDWSAFTVFQFTSKATAITENFKPKQNAATDFIPVKDTSNREINSTDEAISGPEIFSIEKNTVPSNNQIKQIWFAFNLVANYINNKNLKPGGNTKKFISWIEAVGIAYPDNPYMPLFAGVGHIILDNKVLANKRLEQAKQNLRTSKYWNERFKQFGLTDMVNSFPQNREESYGILESMKIKYSEWIRKPEMTRGMSA
jgi:hypothetical protein